MSFTAVLVPTVQATLRPPQTPLLSIDVVHCSTEGRRPRLISEPSSLASATEDGDPVEHYKRVQRGGEIPFKGLQKPAPEKSSKYM